MLVVRRVSGVALVKDGKLILQHRDNGTKFRPNRWGFFGGHINENETPEQAIIREVKEELQIDIVPKFVRSFNFENETGPVEHNVFIANVEHSLEQLRELQTEGDDIGLFTLEQTKELFEKPYDHALPALSNLLPKQ